MSASKFSKPFIEKSVLTPLHGNAFIKAKIDAEKAGKTSFSFNGRNYPLKMEEESPLTEINPRLVSSVADELESRASDQLMASNFGTSDRPDFRRDNDEFKYKSNPRYQSGHDWDIRDKAGSDVNRANERSNRAQAEFSEYGTAKGNRRKIEKPVATFGYSDGVEDSNYDNLRKSKVRHFGSGAPAPEFFNLPTSDRVAVKK